MLGRIATLLRPYRAKLMLVGVAVVTAAILTSIVPFLTKAVFDDALFPKDGGPDLGLLGWLVAGDVRHPDRRRAASASARTG